MPSFPDSEPEWTPAEMSGGDPSDASDEIPATPIRGKTGLPGWAAILGAVAGAAVVGVAVFLGSPVVAALGTVLILTSILAWVIPKLLDYAVLRPMRRAANAANAIAQAAKVLVTGSPRSGEGRFQAFWRILSSIEGMDYLALLIWILLLFVLAWLLWRQAWKKRRKRNG